MPRFVARIALRSALVALAAAALLLPSPAWAAVTIKIATLAPEGSTWHKALVKMGEDWSTLTNGEVTVKIYAGGVVGNETVMLRKMRIGQIHASALTNLGLLEIDPSAQVINTPGLIRSYEELDYVMASMGPKFEEKVKAGGFTVLNWGDVGWAHLFSKQALTDPADVGKLKIFAWEGDPGAIEMYQAGGFKPVVVAATDVVPSLQSGLIDAFPSTPLAALAMQWFGLAPNMLDVPWAPLMGCTIVTNEAWESIPEQYRPMLMESARKNGEEIKATVRAQDQKAVEVMKKYGLTVNSVDAATEAKWEAVAESVHPIVREKIVPSDVFDETKRLVLEYRAAHP